MGDTKFIACFYCGQLVRISEYAKDYTYIYNPDENPKEIAYHNKCQYLPKQSKLTEFL